MHAFVKYLFKAEYTSAFGLRDSEEIMAIPNLTQGIQKYQANRSPVLQMKKGFGFDPPKPFPVGYTSIFNFFI